MYDSTLGRSDKDPVLDNNRQPPNKVLVESVWIDLINPEPPSDNPEDNSEDNDIEPEQVGLKYRYHLHMKNKRLEQTEHLTEKPIVPYNGLTEGNDWTMNMDGSWFIPSMDIVSEIIDISQESYSDNFAQDQLTLKKCATPETKLPPDQHTSLQSNTGANANITLDMTLLQEVQWVKPVHCNSAKKGARLKIQAIGKYIIPGTTLSVNMYYCPKAHGTIISTTATVRQNWHLFVGYQKWVNVDSSKVTSSKLLEIG